VVRTQTYSPGAADLDHHWYVVDADGVVLGRLASAVAQLRGFAGLRCVPSKACGIADKIVLYTPCTPGLNVAPG